MTPSVGPDNNDTGRVRAHPLIRRLVALRLAPDDHVVFGSGPLFAHGLQDHIRDLDVVARGAAWSRAVSLGMPAIGTVSGLDIAHFWGGLIEVSASWISPDWDIDELIDRADVIDGIRFARLSDVLRYKRSLRRSKDVPDIRLLERRSAPVLG